MRKRIGCLHAHYSNIEYIQSALPSDEVEWSHYVDPGLMSRIIGDSLIDVNILKNRVIDQLEWIAQTEVDAILVTCTNYIALLEEDRLATSIPILKIDEPFFDHVCNCNDPQLLLFTNPATVEGTMTRLQDYAASQGKSINHIKESVIDNTFELIMQGNTDQYVKEVSKSIKHLLEADKNRKIAVTQLSMVEAAEQVEREMDVSIANPLTSMAASLRKL